MTAATLDASMTRLESMTGKSNVYNRSKIAEAEALAAEALRMANEAKLAAARLAEVKKTLALFSTKLESAEASVVKEDFKVDTITIREEVETIPAVAKEVETIPAVAKEVETIPAVAKEVETIPAVAKEVKTIPAVVKQASDGPASEESVEVVEGQADEESAKEEPVEAEKEEVTEEPVEAAKEEVAEAPVEVEEPATVVEEPAAVVEEPAVVVEGKVEEPVVAEPSKEVTIEEALVVEEPVQEPPKVEYKEDPPQTTYAVVSKNLINNDVVKVVEATKPAPVVVEATKPAPVVVEATKPAPVVVEATKPAPVVVEATKPAPVVVEAKKPEAVVVEAKEPEAVVVEATKPEPVEATKPEPVEAKEPEPVEAKEPEPVEAKEPEPVVVEAKEPEAVVVETKTPEPVVVETKTPEPVVVETKTPEPVVVETKTPEPVVVEAKTPEPVVVVQASTKREPLPMSPGVNQHRVAFKPVEDALVAPLTQPNDIIEDFLDALGMDKACGLDDETLGFTDRPVPPPAVVEPEPIANPTRDNYSPPLSRGDVFLNSPSFQQEVAARRRQQKLSPRNTQLAAANQDFVDPFGADHDDLAFCGKLADVCEPPAYQDEYVVPAKYR